MPRRFTVAALLALALASCDGPSAGTLDLELSGTDARAARLKIAGPVTDVTAVDPATRVFYERQGDTTIVVVIAEEGHTLSEQPIATLHVTDMDAARRWVIQVVEVAGANYTLQNPQAYEVTISP